MADYVPSTEAEKLAWIAKLAQWFCDNGMDRGFSEREIAPLKEAADDAQASADDYKIKREAADLAMKKKTKVINKAEHRARKVAQRIAYTSSTTDDDRVAAGIPIHKTARTPMPADYVKTLPPPKLFFEYNGGDEITILWGPDPSNKRHTARPPGIRGVRLWYYLGNGPPSNEDDWRFLDASNRSPYTYRLDNAQPVTITYCASYIDRNNRVGVFGEPVTVTINP